MKSQASKEQELEERVTQLEIEAGIHVFHPECRGSHKNDPKAKK